ncbi:MAG: cytochrome c, partial [Deltaproteobacteria bacterium]|nr:cytochrome c [Deltaproteobacteria bacterium]
SLLGFLAVSSISIDTAGAQNRGEGRKLYVTYCTACHGEKGKGDGMAAQSFPVKPADHTNGAVMNQLSDKFLTDVISKGGSAVGKSSFMPAWGSSFNERQIRDIVAYLRTIADPPYKRDGNKR